MAIEGRFDFAAKTNPFGAPKKKLTPEQEQKLEAQKAKLALMQLQARQKGK